MAATYLRFGSIGKTFIYKTLIGAVCLLLFAPQAMAVENPQVVVKNGTDQVLRLLREYPINIPTQRNQIRAVVDKYFDFDEIARRALGPRWNRESPAKQQAFEREFSQLLFNTYVGKIEQYSNEKITFKQKSMEGDHAVVESMIAGNGSQPITVDYYLRLKDGNWKVYDVAIEGMGLVSNYRRQFDEILVRNSFDDLLMRLRQQVARG